MADLAAAQRGAALYAFLGDLPDRQRPISGETMAIAESDGYLREALVPDLNGLEPVPALFAGP